MARVYKLETGTNTTASTATIALDKLGRSTNYDESKSYTNKTVYENMTCPRDRSETFINTVTKLPKGTNILPSNVDAPSTLVRNVKYDVGSRTMWIYYTETESTDPTFERSYTIGFELKTYIPEVNGIDETVIAECMSRFLSSYFTDAGQSQFLRMMTTKIIWDQD